LGGDVAISEFQIDKGGFAPLLIGMSRHEIDEVLDELPTPDRAGLDGEEAFRYIDSHVRVVMRNNQAVEIALVPPAQVSFRGKPVFENHSVWREIVAVDGEASQFLGFIVLRRLGLTLTGFHDVDRGQLAITAFEHGRWDVFEHEMQPLIL
jgi:hypothetical protein